MYPDLASKMAMKIGGKYEAKDVFLRHWHQLVPDTASAKRNLDKKLLSLSKVVFERAEALAGDFAKEGIQSNIFADILNVIGQRAKHLQISVSGEI